MGRWLLPKNGPTEVAAFRENRDEEMIRSMVDDDVLILVPSSFGVTIVLSEWSVITVQIDLPAITVALDSQNEWE